jgi:anti-sigma factor RsiW
MTRPLTTTDARDLFSAAFDGDLDDADQAAFEHALTSDPTLARDYDAFCDTMTAALVDAAPEQVAPAGDTHAAPDLLPGIQQRLRARSGGRFYADRFAEKTVKGLSGPLALSLIMLGVCAVAWLAFQYIQAIEAVGR